METRETLPLCSRTVTTGCFNVDDMSVVDKSKKRSAREYSDVLRWGE
jgi:hypothetical protein